MSFSHALSATVTGDSSALISMPSLPSRIFSARIAGFAGDIGANLQFFFVCHLRLYQTTPSVARAHAKMNSMENFRDFQMGPDPFGRTWHALFKYLQTGISIRHSDSVDVCFVLESGEERAEDRGAGAGGHPRFLEADRAA